MDVIQLQDPEWQDLEGLPSNLPPLDELVLSPKKLKSVVVVPTRKRKINIKTYFGRKKTKSSNATAGLTPKVNSAEEPAAKQTDAGQTVAEETDAGQTEARLS